MFSVRGAQGSSKNNYSIFRTSLGCDRNEEYLIFEKKNGWYIWLRTSAAETHGFYPIFIVLSVRDVRLKSTDFDEFPEWITARTQRLE